MSRHALERTLDEVVEFSREHRSWLTPAGLLLALNIVFFFGFTLRSAGRLPALRSQVESSRAELDAALRDLDRNDRKKALGALAERDLKDLYDRVLLRYDENFHNLRMELEAIMKQANVGATTISYGKQDLPQLGLIQETITFPLKGDYNSLRKLISLIEQSSYFLIIDAIQLTDSSNEGKELNLNMVIVTFFYDPGLLEAARRRGPA